MKSPDEVQLSDAKVPSIDGAMPAKTSLRLLPADPKPSTKEQFPSALKRPQEPPGGLASKDGQSEALDRFLVTARRVLGQVIGLQSVSIDRKSDVDVASAKGEVVVRSTLPDGTQLEARKTLQKIGMRWKRLFPYVVLIISVSLAILLAWKGAQILEVLTRIAGWSR